MSEAEGSLPTISIPIDEEGYPLFSEVRVNDAKIGREILENIRFAENGAMISTLQGKEAIIEAFDEPLVARHITKTKFSTAFEVEFEFDPKTLTVDEWDRFHGLTKKSIPFVLSRTAQKELFDLCDDYDDDSITIDKKVIPVRPWMLGPPEVRTEQYWSQIYQTETPRWELNQAAPALVDMIPRLKMPRSRVLVLGCGSGNDAAELAKAGHLVTAVDISPEAISRAKAKYSQVPGLTFIQSDVFALGEEHTKSYDLVFEHTCFCAIPPERRNELIGVWRRCLVEGGHLLAVLFTMERRSAPPFGGTEWEYRERLKKNFQFLFWGRWQKSIDRRQGKELLVYAKYKG
jgi:SAM-dependent methyltransferase